MGFNSAFKGLIISYIFIPILYMFRATLYSSSGESIVLIRHLIYVGDRLVCTCTLDGHLHRVTYTRYSFFRIYERSIVCQVGYLQELNRDKRSSRHKILWYKSQMSEAWQVTRIPVFHV